MLNEPIIILGAARSGTKFLRDCLAAHQDAYCVPHDVNYIWRYGHPIDSDDVLSVDAITSNQRRFIIRRLYKLANTTPSNGILIEKTVSNTLRVPYVSSVFPNAKYVHLIRDGRDVTLSAMKQWAAPTDLNRLIRKLGTFSPATMPYLFWFAKSRLAHYFTNDRADLPKIWGPRYPGIVKDIHSLSLTEICAKQWQHSILFTLDALKKIPSDRVFSIKYEDLISNETAIENLTNSLGIQYKGDIQRHYRETLQIPNAVANTSDIGNQAVALNTANEALRSTGYID